MENQPAPTIRPTPRFRFPQPQAPPPPRPQPQQPPPQFQPRLPSRPTPRLPLQQLLRPTAVAPPQPQPQPQAPAAAPSRPPPQQPRPLAAVPSQPPPQQPQPPAPAPRQPQQQPPRPDVAPPPQIQQVQTAPSSTDAPTRLEIEPIKKPPSPSPTPKAASREPTPPQSPKTITTSLWPMQSPRTKPSPPPPPPPSLPLPPSQLKPEPEPELSKTMLFQDVKMSESMPRAAPATQTSEFSSNTNSRHSVADVEVPMRVITLAGENKGAWMEFGSPSSLLKNKKKPETIGTVRQQQVEEDGAQGNGKKIEKKNGKGANSTKAPPVPSAFVNSNVQSVNNSIVLHASCTHGDPGVHLAFSRKPAPANGYHRKDHPNGHQT